MSDETVQQQVPAQSPRWLGAAGPSDEPAAFPARAEASRRAGHLAEAEQTARAGLEAEPGSAEGRAVLALVLFDLGRSREARGELERVAQETLDAAAHPLSETAAEFPGEVSDHEFEEAFARAEPDLEQVVDADRVAQQAIREADRALSDETAAPSAAFATRTMAELLERQGDAQGASRIRAALDTRSRRADEPIDPARRAQIIVTLEHWLENLRRNVR